MLIDNTTPEAKKALRIVDKSGNTIRSIVWFNTDTRIASAILKGVERRVEVDRFCFIGGENLKRVLPKSLHDHVMEVF